MQRRQRRTWASRTKTYGWSAPDRPTSKPAGLRVDDRLRTQPAEAGKLGSVVRRTGPLERDAESDGGSETHGRRSNHSPRSQPRQMDSGVWVRRVVYLLPEAA